MSTIAGIAAPDEAVKDMRERPSYAALIPLFGEINDLKRVRSAGTPDTYMCRLFRMAWHALIRGEPAEDVAIRTTRRALAATRLGAIDTALLTRAGMTPEDAAEVVSGAVTDAVASAGPWRPLLTAAFGAEPPDVRQVNDVAEPTWLQALIEQPRAGATSPGKPRLMLEPPENHGDHCGCTAIYAALIAPALGADVGTVFLASLAHHLHNAVMPDAGFTGEEMLGRHLVPVMQTLTSAAIGELPETLRQQTISARSHLPVVDTPEGQAFNTADVFDRVLQMVQYARVAGFSLDQAMDDLELVHIGPVQEFHYESLAEAGLWK